MKQKAGQLIEDVTPLDEVPAYQRGFGKSNEYVCTMTNGKIIAMLHRRGVTIETIFGVYYAIEAQADARDEELFGNDEQGQHGRILKVGDVELAGLVELPKKPKERQVF